MIEDFTTYQEFKDDEPIYVSPPLGDSSFHDIEIRQQPGYVEDVPLVQTDRDSLPTRFMVDGRRLNAH